MNEQLKNPHKSSNLFDTILIKLKKWARKKYIYLKRNPQVFPLLGLTLACIVYTFNLSIHSQTISYMPYKIDAFYAFIITLCSILNIFTFLNFYQKKNYLLYALVIIMSIVQIILDIRYLGTIRGYAIASPQRYNQLMVSSYNKTIFHIVTLFISLAFVIVYPFILRRKKKLKKHEAK
jgi:hypothetical protein